MRSRLQKVLAIALICTALFGGVLSFMIFKSNTFIRVDEQDIELIAINTHIDRLSVERVVKGQYSVGNVDEIPMETESEETSETKPPGGNGGGGGGDYAQQIIDKMLELGYNKYAISGALGSFIAESGLNPNTTQGHTYDGQPNEVVRNWQAGKGGRAIGFAQWDGGRALALIDAAIASGVNWYDFDFQLNYYMSDLSSQGYGVSEANSNCTDVEHAAWFFVKKYERCGTCKYAPCGGSTNGQHGHGTNAAYVDFEHREHINGYNTRSSAAKSFYDTYFGD